MTRLVRNTFGFAAVMALGAFTGTVTVSTAQAQEKCFKAGGEATMVTEDLAKFMARAALKNSIAAASAKPVGEAKVNCKPGFASTYCLAEQKACK